MSPILQSLGTAIAATKVLSAQQVVKNEAGEEVNDFEVNIFRMYWLKSVNVSTDSHRTICSVFSHNFVHRFTFLWARVECRFSKTQSFQITSQRTRRAPRGRSTEPFPAPQPRKIPTGAGSTQLPVSSRKPSIGEGEVTWGTDYCQRRLQWFWSGRYEQGDHTRAWSHLQEWNTWI